MPHARFLIFVAPLLTLPILGCVAQSSSKCRTQPGDPAFPNNEQLSQLNSTLAGRLLAVVPSAQFCKNRGGCTEQEWEDFIFRSNNIPGAMSQVNWEQDYISDPPSLCTRNSTTCGQGSVPLYAINATSAAHIQTGVQFAQKHNLKVSIKASGHDYLGRSTAKNSLLFWTHYMQKISFHDSFMVGGKERGSAVTVGSGVGLQALYDACKAKGKIYVGGISSNVMVAGGYLQGGGHSPLGPLFGLATDNVLEVQVVIANGSLITANEVTNPDLFWAMRGGGAGSWGVIVSATIQTFPTFDIAAHLTSITVNSTTELGQLASLHAQHIFDWDKFKASQYTNIHSSPTFGMDFTTLFPHTSAEAATSSFAPFLDAAAAKGFSVSPSNVTVVNINDAISVGVEIGGFNVILGSRLLPSDLYRHNSTAIGDTYRKLLETNTTSFSQFMVAGGKVSENADVSSAVHPKWRTAKTLVTMGTQWEDTTPPDEVEKIRENFTQHRVPILGALAGPDGASYSNEGDVREPNFQTTFFGDYARLSAIKNAYDPEDFFIVGAGVGSEKWDEEGLCRVA